METTETIKKRNFTKDSYIVRCVLNSIYFSYETELNYNEGYDITDLEITIDSHEIYTMYHESSYQLIEAIKSNFENFSSALFEADEEKKNIIKKIKTYEYTDNYKAGLRIYFFED